MTFDVLDRREMQEREFAIRTGRTYELRGATRTLEAGRLQLEEEKSASAPWEPQLTLAEEKDLVCPTTFFEGVDRKVMLVRNWCEKKDTKNPY
jgi:hypothetical protein